MAACLLCGSGVDDIHPVCPFCGGALDRGAPGIDTTKVSIEKAAADPDPPTPWAGPEAQWPGESDPAFGPMLPAEALAPGDPNSPPYDLAAWPQGAGPQGPYPGGPAGFSGYQGPPGYGPSPGGWAPYPGYQPWAAPPYEPLAIASLVTSIIGFVGGGACLLPILACPVGAVMGHVALSRMARTGHQGRALAIAGAIVGWCGTALVAGILLIWLVLALAAA